MPHRAVNPIEMAMDAMHYLQHKFYTAFPRDEREYIYNFTNASTFKPTQISCTEGSLNQIPPVCTIQGDVRLTPFYDVKDAAGLLQQWVDEINADPDGVLGGMSDRGPHSKYSVAEVGVTGQVKLTILSSENGIAVNLNSRGYAALVSATRDVLGEVKPYSIGGSLPLVREMQSSGFDLQIAGKESRNRTGDTGG
jgi:acetylornithine deacetylase